MISNNPSPTSDISNLPDGPFGTIVADPPWAFNNRATRAAAENHYSTLSYNELTALPVQAHTAPSAHLYLWTTDSHLQIALDVMKAWGFQFKMTLCWVKLTKGLLPHFGTGNYYRQRARALPFRCAREGAGAG